jgi:hypothetical protein
MEQTTTTTAPTLFRNALRWAIIMGIVSILFTIILYVIDYTLMVQMKMLLVALAIYFGIAIYGGIEYRNSIGGYLSYGKAWQHAMIVFAISALMSTAWNLIFYNVIDPELPGKLTDAAIENQRAMMQSFGAPEDQIDTALEQARTRAADQYTVGGMAIGYLIILAVSAVMALITSIFVKRNEPVEM